MYRLWQTYSACEGEVVRLPDIVDGYCRNEINDKENCPRENELGRIILRIFPEVKKVQKLNHEDGMKKKCWRYSNIKKCDPPTPLTWANLAETYSPPKPTTSSMCWVQNKRCSDYVQWMIIPSDNTCGCRQLIRELRLHNNLVFELYVMSKKVDTISLGHGVQTFMLTKGFLDNLFQYCAIAPLCRGFEVEVEKNTHDRHGNVIGSSELWEFASRSGETISSLRHSSHRCALILDVTRHSTICTSCANIKFNSFYKTLKPEDGNVSKKINELKHKVHIEKEKRIRAEKREDYAKEKLLTETKVFNESDHSDFKVMFDNLEENSLNLDMKIFWHVQHDILQTRSPKGYRLAPKVSIMDRTHV